MRRIPTRIQSVSDPDTLHYNNATRKKGSREFKSNMFKETRDRFGNGNFAVVHKSEVPSNQTVLPAVWQMRQKRDAKTGKIKKCKIKKCKVRLNNIRGSRMQKGIITT